MVRFRWASAPTSKHDRAGAERPPSGSAASGWRGAGSAAGRLPRPTVHLRGCTGVEAQTHELLVVFGRKRSCEFRFRSPYASLEFGAACRRAGGVPVHRGLAPHAAAALGAGVRGPDGVRTELRGANVNAVRRTPREGARRRSENSELSTKAGQAQLPAAHDHDPLFREAGRKVEAVLRGSSGGVAADATFGAGAIREAEVVRLRQGEEAGVGPAAAAETFDIGAHEPGLRRSGTRGAVAGGVAWGTLRPYDFFHYYPRSYQRTNADLVLTGLPDELGSPRGCAKRRRLRQPPSSLGLQTGPGTYTVRRARRRAQACPPPPPFAEPGQPGFEERHLTGGGGTR